MEEAGEVAAVAEAAAAEEEEEEEVVVEVGLEEVLVPPKNQ